MKVLPTTNALPIFITLVAVLGLVDAFCVPSCQSKTTALWGSKRARNAVESSDHADVESRNKARDLGLHNGVGRRSVLSSIANIATSAVLASTAGCVLPLAAFADVSDDVSRETIEGTVADLRGEIAAEEARLAEENAFIQEEKAELEEELKLEEAIEKITDEEIAQEKAQAAKGREIESNLAKLEEEEALLKQQKELEENEILRLEKEAEQARLRLQQKAQEEERLRRQKEAARQEEAARKAEAKRSAIKKSLTEAEIAELEERERLAMEKAKKEAEEQKAMAVALKEREAELSKKLQALEDEEKALKEREVELARRVQALEDDRIKSMNEALERIEAEEAKAAQARADIQDKGQFWERFTGKQDIVIEEERSKLAAAAKEKALKAGELVEELERKVTDEEERGKLIEAARETARKAKEAYEEFERSEFAVTTRKKALELEKKIEDRVREAIAKERERQEERKKELLLKRKEAEQWTQELNDLSKKMEGDEGFSIDTADTLQGVLSDMKKEREPRTSPLDQLKSMLSGVNDVLPKK